MISPWSRAQHPSPTKSRRAAWCPTWSSASDRSGSGHRTGHIRPRRRSPWAGPGEKPWPPCHRGIARGGFHGYDLKGDHQLFNYYQLLLKWVSNRFQWISSVFQMDFIGISRGDHQLLLENDRRYCISCSIRGLRPRPKQLEAHHFKMGCNHHHHNKKTKNKVEGFRATRARLEKNAQEIKMHKRCLFL